MFGTSLVLVYCVCCSAKLTHYLDIMVSYPLNSNSYSAINPKTVCAPLRKYSMQCH